MRNVCDDARGIAPNLRLSQIFKVTDISRRDIGSRVSGVTKNRALVSSHFIPAALLPGCICMLHAVVVVGDNVTPCRSNLALFCFREGKRFFPEQLLLT